MNITDLRFVVDNLSNPQAGHHTLTVLPGDTIMATFTWKYRGPAISGQVGLGVVPPDKAFTPEDVRAYGGAWLLGFSLPQTLEWQVFSKVYQFTWMTHRTPPFLRGSYQARADIVVGGTVVASSAVKSNAFYHLPTGEEMGWLKGVCVPSETTQIRNPVYHGGPLAGKSRGGTIYCHHYPVPKLRAEWWYDWGIFECYYHVLKYVPMVWSGAAPAKLTAQAAAIRAARGSGADIYWMLFNEPDDAWQANLSSTLVTTRYINYYLAIKAGDPAAKIGGIGITWIEPDGSVSKHGRNHWPGPIVETNYVRTFFQGLSAWNVTRPPEMRAYVDFWTFHDWFGRWHNSIVTYNQPNNLTWEPVEKHIAKVKEYSAWLAPGPISDFWLTETGYQLGGGGNATQAAIYMDRLFAWAATPSPVSRIAWFASFPCWPIGYFPPEEGRAPWKSALYDKDPRYSCERYWDEGSQTYVPGPTHAPNALGTKWRKA